MYAIIKTGGKQYRVAEGDVITVEKLTAGEGEVVTFDEVLTVVKDGEVVVGRFLDGGKTQGRDDVVIADEGNLALFAGYGGTDDERALDGFQPRSAGTVDERHELVLIGAAHDGALSQAFGNRRIQFVAYRTEGVGCADRERSFLSVALNEGDGGRVFQDEVSARIPELVGVIELGGCFRHIADRLRLTVGSRIFRRGLEGRGSSVHNCPASINGQNYLGIMN